MQGKVGKAYMYNGLHKYLSPWTFTYFEMLQFRTKTENWDYILEIYINCP